MAREAEKNSGLAFTDPADIVKDEALLHTIDRHGGVTQRTRDQIVPRLYRMLMDAFDEYDAVMELAKDWEPDGETEKPRPDILLIERITNIIARLDKQTLEWRKQLFAELGNKGPDSVVNINMGEFIREFLGTDAADIAFQQVQADAAAEEEARRRDLDE